ncbi:hypothetical protein CHLRE_12g540900v5 [Chlamydomonas reinhardtii]|uniref:Uncharacterized protein n=1 Tax=Chlamydomonas reinhardtii TaxID=3055 RepID=A8IYV7_CHLRE|nr:uncharacterized protein CHLRE_12g540900v5 [Chlamydomonas reinhardtii]PNW76281.1 hypothetical protein CHLRE_12g540900v5 [Chlamydomonas reinhardtii]|eukprot:XP_001693907.1 predicted protein [Chlamydomonas reinhardtii]
MKGAQMFRPAAAAAAAATVLLMCCVSSADTGSSARASAVAVSSGGSPSTAFSGSVAGPGQDASSSVVVVNGKTLVNDSQVLYNQASADLAWDAAPACPAESASQPVVLDSMGRPWSWNPASQQSCAVRPSPAGPPAATVAWDAAPRCSFAPTADTATPDASGRLWSWQGGASCAHKNSDGTPIYYDGYQAAGRRRALLGRTGDDASSAAVTMPVTKIGATLTDGAAVDVEVQQLLDWTAALPCPMAPNANNSATDARGWLWGQSQGARCAFKAAGSRPIYYPGYVAANYDLAPLCSAAVSRATSMADWQGRLWNWEAGVNCVHTCERPSDQLAAALAAAAVQTALAANTSAAGAQPAATSEPVATAADGGKDSAAAAAQVAVDATLAAAVDARAAVGAATAPVAAGTAAHQQVPANATAAKDKAEAEAVRAAAHGDALVAMMGDPETAAALAEAAGPATGARTDAGDAVVAAGQTDIAVGPGAGRSVLHGAWGIAATLKQPLIWTTV